MEEREPEDRYTFANESTDEFVARLRIEAARYRSERQVYPRPPLKQLTEEEKTELRKLGEGIDAVAAQIAALYEKSELGGGSSTPR